MYTFIYIYIYIYICIQNEYVYLFIYIRIPIRFWVSGLEILPGVIREMRRRKLGSSSAPLTRFDPCIWHV